MHKPTLHRTMVPTQQALLNRDAFADVEAEVARLPGYQPTPLIALNGLAAASGVAGLWCKHEGYRFEVGSFKTDGARLCNAVCVEE